MASAQKGAHGREKRRMQSRVVITCIRGPQQRRKSWQCGCITDRDCAKISAEGNSHDAVKGNIGRQTHGKKSTKMLSSHYLWVCRDLGKQCYQRVEVSQAVWVCKCIEPCVRDVKMRGRGRARKGPIL